MNRLGSFPIFLVASLFAAGVLATTVSPAAQAADPPLGTECRGSFDDTVHEPVLLVHGTFTNGWEHWRWNWYSVLGDAGWDVCAITLPDRSLGDMQLQGEKVRDAILYIAGETGEKVDVLGHSQGAVHPRWAVKWWSDARASVDDLVMLAGPQHGTALGGNGSSPIGCFESCWQMMPGSDYLQVLNAVDETPGDVSYTSIYSAMDELVQPQVPASTSALDGGTNLLIQEVCPGRPVDHVFMMVDHAVATLVYDAFTGSGAADLARAGGLLGVCTGTYMENMDPSGHGAEIMQRSFQQGFPNFRQSEKEPGLRPYAGS